jgi:hypothetical protein
MSDNTNWVAHSHVVTTMGSIDMQAKGYGVNIVASGLEGTATLSGEIGVDVQAGQAIVALTNEGAAGNVSISAGELGTIRQVVGPPLLGACLEMGPEEITISVGPPGVGASITLLPEQIILKVAETTFSMTPLGIMESIAATSRSMTPVGHAMAAAEVESQITPMGIVENAPIATNDSQAITELEAALMMVN